MQPSIETLRIIFNNVSGIYVVELYAIARHLQSHSIPDGLIDGIDAIIDAIDTVDSILKP